jgi:SsrA-binding protein
MNSINIENRKAYHDYFVKNMIECGIALRGNEVKSIRKGSCNLKGAWCTIQDGQLVARGIHISKWDSANAFDVDETRERVLLAHKQEIRKLEKAIKEQGVTLIPLKMYFFKGKCKILIGECVGKHNYDKRETLKQKDIQREIQKSFKENNR